MVEGKPGLTDFNCPAYVATLQEFECSLNQKTCKYILVTPCAKSFLVCVS